ncbi:MAG: hypothetical protein KAT09_03660 [Candidatus Aegiribacteria sp.]|nr:hypothetical protein [Candidatus Aegiribacteria sp.]
MNDVRVVQITTTVNSQEEASRIAEAAVQMEVVSEAYLEWMLHTLAD